MTKKRPHREALAQSIGVAGRPPCVPSALLLLRPALAPSSPPAAVVRTSLAGCQLRGVEFVWLGGRTGQGRGRRFYGRFLFVSIV